MFEQTPSTGLNNDIMNTMASTLTSNYYSRTKSQGG